MIIDRVFIADDEDNSQKLLLSLLESYPDFSIEKRVYSGRQAYDSLQKETYDIAFLDVGMPDMTGIEVVRRLRETNVPLPYIIFITAFWNHAADAFDLGAIDYIIKPVSQERLNKALEKYKIFRKAEGNPPVKGLVEVLMGQYAMTCQEVEICKLVKKGFVREEVQKVLKISSATLKTHLTHIYDKTLQNKAFDERTDKFSALLYFLFSLQDV